MTGGPRALIDLNALRYNLNRARSAAAGSRVMAVVKADAYGHGVQAAAEALQDADAFAVARVDEGVALRRSGTDKDILVMGGFLDQDELRTVAQWGLQTAIHQPYQARMLEQLSDQQSVTVWIKINSGMNRLGVNPDQVDELYRDLQQMPSVKSIHWMTHFACADDLQDATTTAQIGSFERAIGDKPGSKSLANSAAILGWPQAHADWVRPGIMLYGASPFLDREGQQDDLRPVMTLCSSVVSLRDVQAGAQVGYGGTWRAERTSRVAVVGIGYGDGYPRQAEPGTPVLIRGQRLPLIGRVSMDSITVDVSALPDVQVGDAVELWGPGLPAEIVAAHCGTISYHLFCGVTSRVPRIYQT